MYTQGLTLMLALTLTSPAPCSVLLAGEDFADFGGTGLAPGGGAGALDSEHWSVSGASDGDAAFGARVSRGDLARGLSAGGERGGGLYAFELPGGRRGLGIQATGSDFTPGALVYRTDGVSGSPIPDLAASFELWVLNDGSRSTRLSVETAAGTGPWLTVPALGLDSPASADASGWQRHLLEASLPVGSLAAGEALMLRWRFDDLAGNGSRDEIALAALRLSGSDPASAVVLAAPGSGALTLAGLALALRNVRRPLLTRR